MARRFLNNSTLGADPKNLLPLFIGETSEEKMKSLSKRDIQICWILEKKNTTRLIPRVPIMCRRNNPKSLMCFLRLENTLVYVKTYQTGVSLKKQLMSENLQSRFQQYRHRKDSTICAPRN